MMLPNDIGSIVKQALEEDIRDGDITARLIQPTSAGSARVICRGQAIICGAAWFDAAFHELDRHCVISWKFADGDLVQPGDVVCELRGPARALVTGERTALNFLQTLSGTATTTRAYANCLKETKTVLLDTRKTLPGLRSAQKYAVLCGGGENHRAGLFDGILIKENHIEAAGSITQAIARMRAEFFALPIEIEVESIEALAEAMDAGADIVLLDNFSDEDIEQAVHVNAGRVKLEASGSYDLAKMEKIANIGVDFISVGSLTKHLTAIDFSMRFHATRRSR